MNSSWRGSSLVANPGGLLAVRYALFARLRQLRRMHARALAVDYQVADDPLGDLVGREGDGAVEQPAGGGVTELEQPPPAAAALRRPA
jgi:hypothetical protein